MNLIRLCAIILFIAARCLGQGESLGPAYGGVGMMVDEARSGPDKERAVGSLKLIVEGRPEELDPVYIKKIGVDPAIYIKYVSNSGPRAVAATGLGETGTVAVFDYLAGLKRADIVDTTRDGMVWGAVQTALRAMQLARITDPHQQIEFLEKVALEIIDPFAMSKVTSWAVDELCDRGSLLSLPVARAALVKANSGPDGLENAQFCETRMRIIMSNPDRTRALASYLKTAKIRPDRRLAAWAVIQLSLIRSPEANKAMDAFEEEITKYPRGTPERDAFLGIGQLIRSYQEKRVK